jgi:ubiquinone/menaquinone biosynthesis C-methylase UbiE
MIMEASSGSGLVGAVYANSLMKRGSALVCSDFSQSMLSIQKETFRNSISETVSYEEIKDVG